MKAMILAAGRGERMRPLTDSIPKALVEVGGRSLIEWQVRRFAASGVGEIVINVSWLGEKIVERLGNGNKFGVHITYSREVAPLESLGGVVQALPLLGNRAFVVVSADVYAEFNYASLQGVADNMDTVYPRLVAHLVLTDNPPFHPEGDMALAHGEIRLEGNKLNYANIGVFHPRLFDEQPVGHKARLFPWLYQFLGNGRVTGQYFHGVWENIGTMADATALDRRLRALGVAQSR